MALGVSPPPSDEHPQCDAIYSGIGLECFLFVQTLLNQPDLLLGNGSFPFLCNHTCFANATTTLRELGTNGCTIPGWGATALANMSSLLVDAVCSRNKDGQTCARAFGLIPDAGVAAIEGQPARVAPFAALLALQRRAAQQAAPSAAGRHAYVCVPCAATSAFFF